MKTKHRLVEIVTIIVVVVFIVFMVRSCGESIDCSARLEVIESRLEVLGEGIIANDDNIRRVAVIMTEYIDKVNFEGKQE